jgi:hypothetical protein
MHPAGWIEIAGGRADVGNRLIPIYGMNRVLDRAGELEGVGGCPDDQIREQVRIVHVGEKDSWLRFKIQTVVADIPDDADDFARGPRRRARKRRKCLSVRCNRGQPASRRAPWSKALRESTKSWRQGKDLKE